MSTNVPPSRDPANDDSLIGFTRELKRWLFKNINKSLPVEVISHDRANNRVRVRPLITMVDSENNEVQRSEIASVPVLNLGAGGFMINFHIPAGQQGIILAQDRDISLFLQDQSESRPNTERMHSFEDAVYIPQQWFNFTINDEDAEAMVIQSLDNTKRIALDQTSIRIVNGETRATYTDQDITVTAPNNISFDAGNDFIINAGNAFTVTANTMNATASGGITLNNVTIDSAGALASPVSVTAPMVSGTTDVSAGGISGLNHTHGGVTPGSGNSGGPQ